MYFIRALYPWLEDLLCWRILSWRLRNPVSGQQTSLYNATIRIVCHLFHWQTNPHTRIRHLASEESVSYHFLLFVFNSIYRLYIDVSTTQDNQSLGNLTYQWSVMNAKLDSTGLLQSNPSAKVTELDNSKVKKLKSKFFEEVAINKRSLSVPASNLQ